MWTEWSTAQIALVVSVFSLALAFSSLVWNIWSKFIYPKPKLRVRACFVLFESGLEHIHYFPSHITNLQRLDSLVLTMPAIQVWAINSGPGDVDIGTPIYARKKPYHPKKEGYTIFSELVSYPWGMLKDEDIAKSRKPLESGRQRAFYVPVSRGELDEWKMAAIGFIDALGRKHFCSRRDIKNINEVARRYFSKVAP